MRLLDPHVLIRMEVINLVTMLIAYKVSLTNLLLLQKILEEVRKNGERMTNLEERVRNVETEESSNPASRKSMSINPSRQLRVSLV